LPQKPLQLSILGPLPRAIDRYLLRKQIPVKCSNNSPDFWPLVGLDRTV